MAKIFEILTDLPFQQQQEVARIQAKDSGVRTTAEADFLTSLAPYLVNTVLLKVSSLIYIASGTTVPDAYEGFAKGALFIKTDAADGVKGLYENIGTTSDCDFNKIGDITSAEIADDAIVTAKVLDAAITAAKLASSLNLSGKTITNLSIESGTPVNAVAASGTLTSDNTNVSNNDTVTIGSQVYTFKTSLTASTTAYEVLIGSDADDSLLNLKKAINLEAGGGTKYGSLTPANTTVTSGSVTAHAIALTAITNGTAANSTATTETSSHLSFGNTTLTGGVDGTVGTVRKILVDTSYLYIAIAANTVADANWRRVSLGSAF